MTEERLNHLEPKVREQVLHAAGLPKEKRLKEQQELVKKYVDPLQISEDEIAKRFPEYAASRDQTRKAIAARERDRPTPLEKLAALVDTDPNPPAHHVLIRGQHNSPGREAQPGVPAVLCTLSNGYKLPSAGSRGLEGGRKKPITSGRRSAFARWVTSPENPLFARTMVNRVWQHHFASGLVVTPDNLGQSGAKPTHPELLDWLAVEFAASGYSVKHLHRLILRSAVFRQSSRPRQDGLATDPDNRLLWRYPLHGWMPRHCATLCWLSRGNWTGTPVDPTSRRGWRKAPSRWMRTWMAPGGAQCTCKSGGRRWRRSWNSSMPPALPSIVALVPR